MFEGRAVGHLPSHPVFRPPASTPKAREETAVLDERGIPVHLMVEIFFFFNTKALSSKSADYASLARLFVVVLLLDLSDVFLVLCYFRVKLGCMVSMLLD